MEYIPREQICKTMGLFYPGIKGYVDQHTHKGCVQSILLQHDGSIAVMGTSGKCVRFDPYYVWGLYDSRAHSDFYHGIKEYVRVKMQALQPQYWFWGIHSEPL